MLNTLTLASVRGCHSSERVLIMRMKKHMITIRCKKMKGLCSLLAVERPLLLQL
uniref:Uncharacterized protein n=1 Tax=Parascaris equorum TaxID=6256 RepID=A0A914RD60_PAREQ